MFDWTRLEQPVRVKVELDKPLMERRERGKLVQGDENANAIVAEVYQTDGVPYDLTGSTVTLTFVRPDNLAAPPITAEIVGDGNNIAVATLTDTCYRYSGMYVASLKIAKGDVERTIVRILGDVISTENSGVVDDEVLFPSPEELLETLAQVETARQNAEAAAARANAGAERVEQLKIDASGLAGDSNKLNGKPPEYYLPAVNLLTNSYWGGKIVGGVKQGMVNQKGLLTYTGTTETIYDRWQPNNANIKVELLDGYNLISNVDASSDRTIYHVIDGDYSGDTFTLAVCTADGEIMCGTGVMPGATSGSTTATVLTVFGVCSFRLQYIRGYSGVSVLVKPNKSVGIKWMRLLPGTYTAETIPPFAPPDPVLELQKCQFYYREQKMLLLGYVYGVNSIWVFGNVRQKMAATPTTVTATVSSLDLKTTYTPKTYIADIYGLRSIAVESGLTVGTYVYVSDIIESADL